MATERIGKLEGENALRTALAYLRQELQDQANGFNNFAKATPLYMDAEYKLWRLMTERDHLLPVKEIED